MSTTISFNSNKTSIKNQPVKLTGPYEAEIKYAYESDLPDGIPKNTMLFCVDTGSLYIGQGASVGMIKLNNLNGDAGVNIGTLQTTILAIQEQLKSFREKEVLITEDDLAKAVLDKLNQISEPYDDSEVKQDIQDLEDSKADKTDLDAYRKLDKLINFNELEEALQNLINNKISKKDFDDFKSSIETNLSNYRLTSTKITEDDLDSDTKSKLNYTYNDTEVKEAIQSLNDTKLSEEDADEKYRDKSIAIVEGDLSSDLATKINSVTSAYDDTAIKESIQTLSTNKLSKADADKNYRAKDTPITESDLDSALVTKINSVPDAYDDSALKAEDARLEKDKADKTEVTALQTSLNSTIASKADASALDNYRLTATKIEESDLSTVVQTKLNAASTSFDDSKLVKEDERLESAKLDKTTFETYKTSNDTAVSQAVSNASAANTAAQEAKQDASDAKSLVASKADASDVESLTTELSTTKTSLNSLSQKVTTAENTIKTNTSSISSLSADVKTLQDSLTTANSTITSLTTSLQSAVDRITALEAYHTSTDPEPTPDPTPDPNPDVTEGEYKYTLLGSIDITGAGATQFNLKDMDGWTGTEEISVWDFYGIAEEDETETFKPELQKYILKYYGHRMKDTVTYPDGIEFPDGIQVPLSIEADRIAAYNATYKSCNGYVDYDSDLGQLSFEYGSPDTKIYKLFKRELVTTTA